MFFCSFDECSHVFLIRKSVFYQICALVKPTEFIFGASLSYRFYLGKNPPLKLSVNWAETQCILLEHIAASVAHDVILGGPVCNANCQ